MAVRRPHYEKVKDLLSAEAFEARLDSVIAEWGGLLDRETAAMVVVERLGRSVASFTRVADLEEGMEANLRATVVSISPVRTFTRQDGTEGRVTNLELRDESGSCRFALWDDDVGLVERGKVAVGTTVRALDCYVKRTNFGLDEAVKAVREAIEASGRTPRVDVVKSRSDHPPRIVTADGIQARFRIEVTRHPAGAEGGLEWTEIVESSASRDGAEAQALRKKVRERLGGESSPDG